jgi:CRP-like cAMP-binding protein
MQTLDADTLIEHLGMDYLKQQPALAEMSAAVIVELFRGGKLLQLDKGEFIAHFSEKAEDFQLILQGRLAYYKRCDSHDVLTRYFGRGEQIGFDEMIGLLPRDGTDVAVEQTLLLSITSEQFFKLHLEHPAEFGILMINLARELSREIEILEDVIGEGTGWLPGS